MLFAELLQEECVALLLILDRLLCEELLKLHLLGKLKLGECRSLIGDGGRGERAEQKVGCCL